jgi:chemotaxis protein MotB
MMSLFIVLWLLNTTEHVRKAVAGYLNDPGSRSHLNGTQNGGKDNNSPVTGDSIQQLKERLEQAIMKAKDFQALSKQIEMTVTPEGMRIELLESKNGTFFDSGSANLNDDGRELLGMLAKQLGTVPNHLSIEGHTDSQPYSNNSNYGNWELSTDRANATRRLMQETGLRSDQVSQVRGYASSKTRSIRRTGESRSSCSMFRGSRCSRRSPQSSAWRRKRPLTPRRRRRKAVSRQPKTAQPRRPRRQPSDHPLRRRKV